MAAENSIELSFEDHTSAVGLDTTISTYALMEKNNEKMEKALLTTVPALHMHPTQRVRVDAKIVVTITLLDDDQIKGS